MASTDSVLNTDFSKIRRSLERLERARGKVQELHDQQLVELRELLMERLALHRELFAGVTRDYERAFPAVRRESDKVESWSVHAGELTVTLSYWCGDTRDCYEVSLPVRYLNEGWQEAMRKDAAQALAQQVDRARQQTEGTAAAERETLRQLLQKYPEEAARLSAR